MAWGFYGHRRGLYRSTPPHRGFELLRRWGEARPAGYGVFTSNVDGQFQLAGFDPERIHECHGAIEFEQCVSDCGAGIYPAPPEDVHVELETLLAAEPLPSCPQCGGLSRPNILMFGDWGYDSDREGAQARKLRSWLQGVDRTQLVVVECDLARVEQTRRDWPFLRDRRIDAYQSLGPRFVDDPQALDELLISRAGNGTMTWDDAAAKCKRRKVEGMRGWKLPSKGQLIKLRKAKLLQGGSYWSRSMVGGKTPRATKFTAN